MPDDGPKTAADFPDHGYSFRRTAGKRFRLADQVRWQREDSLDFDTPHRRLAAKIIIVAWKDLKSADHKIGAARFLCETLWLTGLAVMFRNVTQEQMKGMVAGAMVASPNLGP